MLNTTMPPEDSDRRPVAFYLANSHLGVLPEELDCRGWMFLEPDSPEDPVLVFAATAGRMAVFLAANLNERGIIAALAAALEDRRIELVVAGPGGASCHQLHFSPSEAKHVDGLMAEYLELGYPCDRDWLTSFRPVASRLPDLCKHLNPALATCERQVTIVLQGSYENHLRAVRTALLSCSAY
jgi:hypothetical protein